MKNYDPRELDFSACERAIKIWLFSAVDLAWWGCMKTKDAANRCDPAPEPFEEPP
jgi:hypothetical protein